MTSVYGFHNYGDSFNRHQHTNSFYAPAPVAPAYTDMYAPQHHHQFSAYHAGFQAPPPPPPQAFYAPQQHMPVQAEAPEAVTGGVTSVLDYDLSIMSKFLTYLAFRLFARGDTDNTKFNASLKSVLSAVRLPLSSLILASYYLLQKYEKEPTTFSINDDDFIFQTLVLSLVLANKANDDNTFTNKSWSDATGLPIRVLNTVEANWLAMLSWRLHDVDMSRYNELHHQFTKYAQNVEKHQQKLNQQQQQHHQQKQHAHSHSMASYSPYPREPVSPIMSDGSEFSPRYDHGLGHYQQPSWSSYEYQSAGFEPHPQQNQSMRFGGRQKSYSVQLEPEYCASSGSYQRNMYCSCRFCSNPSRQVDWSYSSAVC